VGERNYFISDNASGVHPDVLAALSSANRGHATAYGHDAWTERSITLFRKHFGSQANVLLALTGTGANVIGLQSVLRSHEAVICADCAHMHRDECGAPERFTGSKLLPAPTTGGKLSPDAIRPLLADTSMVHRVQPRVVSVSQCTEWGTVYSVSELCALAEFCHENGLLLHMDGARLCNAAAALGVSLKEASGDCGVDILSFGGTKNGLMGAEAVVYFEPRFAEGAAFARKQAMQLCSKMRFVAAQFEALLDGDLWQRNAGHANAMATRLAAAIEDIDGIELVMPVETNAVFARMAPAVVNELQTSTVFAVWDSAQSIVRWMTSFDTATEEIDRFAGRIRDVCRNA
jgi:threonine aldolase